MSFDALLWATNDAPIADVNEFAVLLMLAEKADADGCNAFPSRLTMAARTHIDPKTVLRTLQRLEKRRLIAKGNQAAVTYIRADRRPVVYDLMIPYSWFSNVERINKERQDRGRPALSPEDRPDLAAPPEKRRRSDLGKRRAQTPDKRGDYKSPRSEGVEPGHGVTLSPERGDYKSGTGGLVVTRTSPLNQPGETSSSPASPPTADGPVEQAKEGGGGGDAPQRQDGNPTAAAFVDGLPYRGPLPGPKARTHLVERTAAALAAGWLERDLLRQLTADTGNAKSMAAVFRYRLDPENLPAAPERTDPGALPGPRAVVNDTAGVRRECAGQDGMCGRPLPDAEGDLCHRCAQSTADEIEMTKDTTPVLA